MDLESLKKLLSSPERTAEALAPVKAQLESLYEADKVSKAEKAKEEDAAEDDVGGEDDVKEQVEDTDFVRFLKELGDAARDEEWRVPFGKAGILQLAADFLNEGAGGSELKRQALRVCGNSCAEQDANREILVNRPYGLKPFTASITNFELLVFAVPVLYNICVDYEAAQKKAIEDGAGDALCELLKLVDVVSEEDDDGTQLAQAEHLLQLAELLSQHDSFKEGLDPASLTPLLRYSLSPKLKDLDLYSYLLSIITSLLANARFQAYLINTSSVKVLLDILEDSYSRFSKDDTPETTKILTHLRKALIIALSDVSSNKAFPEKYPLETSTFLKKLNVWLSAPEVSPDSKDKSAYLLSEALQTSACIMLGNVATSDSACLTLVKSHQIHLPLIKIMGQKSKDPGTVFSAVGMLRNLVLPAENKVAIGKPESGIWEALEARWEHALEGGVEKQVPYAVSGLGRLLTKGCKENALALLEPTKTPLQNVGAKTTTRLSVLLRLWAKNDEVPIKTEIARTVCEIFRCIAQWKSKNTTELEKIAEVERHIFDVEEKYAEYGRILEVITSLVVQNKWPVVRSEGLFALGLYCAGFGKAVAGKNMEELDKVGARKVWAVRESWVEVVTGEKTAPGVVEAGKVVGEVGVEGEDVDGGEKKKKDEDEEDEGERKPLEGKDFANAVAMVAEIRRRLDGEFTEEETQYLDDLLKKMTEKLTS